MFVLEHHTKSGARVLRVRPTHLKEELFEFAQPGDTIYVVPDELVSDESRDLIQALQGRKGIQV